MNARERLLQQELKDNIERIHKKIDQTLDGIGIKDINRDIAHELIGKVTDRCILELRDPASNRYPVVVLIFLKLRDVLLEFSRTKINRLKYKGHEDITCFTEAFDTGYDIQRVFEDKDELRQLQSSMNPTAWSCFKLHEMGFTYREIAQILGKSEAYLKKIVHKLRIRRPR